MEILPPLLKVAQLVGSRSRTGARSDFKDFALSSLRSRLPLAPKASPPTQRLVGGSSYLESHSRKGVPLFSCGSIASDLQRVLELPPRPV